MVEGDGCKQDSNVVQTGRLLLGRSVMPIRCGIGGMFISEV